jgi:pimeloyl-ACP methyl ester carboxylesterase
VNTGGGVVLEVLDWGGAGLPVIVLAGLGNSAHIFDDLASAFIDRWHVLGVSRRGFGASTVTASGYDVRSLGGDILRVLDALQIARAIFVGHSIAGEELTWLGSEHPDRVLGLVYLDAAYDRVVLSEHRPPPTPEPDPTPADLASPIGYAAHMSRGMGMPIPLDEVLAGFKFDSDGHFLGISTNPSVIRQIAEAVRVPDYTQLRAPTLALYALADHWTADYASYTATERERFAHAVPSARVEAIPHSKHYLFLTNRAEVVRELRSFLTELERPASSRR